MAKGYWIGRVDVSDVEQYKLYVAANALPFKHYGAKFVVRGGQFPELRTRPTLESLERVTRAQLMPPATSQALAQAYVFLRQVEHRIQYLDDQQTHLLPTDDDDLAWIAAAAHYPRLLQAGVEVFENRQGEHSKIILVDEAWVAFGSYNFEHAAHDRLAEAMLASRDPRTVAPVLAILDELRSSPDNLQVSEEEVNRSLIEEARRFPGQERKIIEYYRSQPEALAQLRAPLFEDKVVARHRGLTELGGVPLDELHETPSRTKPHGWSILVTQW